MENLIITESGIIGWLKNMSGSHDIYAPALKRRGEFMFSKIEGDLIPATDYCMTMDSPRRFIYPSNEKLLNMNRLTGETAAVEPDKREKIIFGVHPCDMQAITVLDRTFLGGYRDYYYKKSRESAVTVIINCRQACRMEYPSFTLMGFCASMKAGPFLQTGEGYDIELTRLTDDKNIMDRKYLVEFGSEKGNMVFRRAGELLAAADKEIETKKELERTALTTFRKTLETGNLPGILQKNLNHPVYDRVANERCLNCTNCTMVCPTCYCYDTEDSTLHDLIYTDRSRKWDSCQELNFARIHDANMRQGRGARLRQFVTHKLSNWVEQYGCFGCVGCGRCMTWCPTNIDLTDIAKEIRETSGKKNEI